MIRLPEGVQDFLPEECYNKTILERKLASVFRGYGYCKAEPPTLEYSETYSKTLSPEKMKKAIKLVDTDGSMLVMRPDPTLQISRMVATKLDKGDISRLFYNVNSFEFISNPSSSRSREFAQVGVELLGKSGLDGDIEMITLAIESLLSLGLENFVIELGSMQFFKGIIEEMHLSEENSYKLMDFVAIKDALGIEIFLKQMNVSLAIREKILILPTLFGDSKVLDRAMELAENKRSKDAITELKTILARLTESGYDKYVSIDLGMVSSSNYYTGLIMRGVVEELGVSILDGGRYDDLASAYNAEIDAIGFTIGTKRTLIALERQGKLEKLPIADCAYVNINSSSKIENDFIANERRKGKICVKQFYANEKALIEFCKNNGIPKAIVFKNDNALEMEVE